MVEPQRGSITRSCRARDRTPLGFDFLLLLAWVTGGRPLRGQPPALRCNPFGVQIHTGWLLHPAYLASESESPAVAVLTLRMRFSQTSSPSRPITSATGNEPTFLAFMSLIDSSRNATVPAACSFSPTISRYGTFSSDPSRIFEPIFSGR